MPRLPVRMMSTAVSRRAASARIAAATRSLTECERRGVGWDEQAHGHARASATKRVQHRAIHPGERLTVIQ